MIVHTCESTLQAVAIDGIGYRAEVAGSSPAVELFSPLFSPLSFSPFPLFLPSLPFISPPSFFPFMLAPPLQCSSIFLVIASSVSHSSSCLYVGKLLYAVSSISRCLSCMHGYIIMHMQLHYLFTYIMVSLVPHTATVFHSFSIEYSNST